jgi:hypothetical protein
VRRQAAPVQLRDAYVADAETPGPSKAS